MIIKNGFTLFEVLLVLFIVTSVTAFGVINLFRLQTVFQLRSSADEIRAQLQYGRELAIAGKDQLPYRIILHGGIISLEAGQQELSRYQMPPKIIASPESFSWDFLPLTGVINACSPCQLTLSSGDVIETITIQENGIIN